MNCDDREATVYCWHCRGSTEYCLPCADLLHQGKRASHRRTSISERPAKPIKCPIHPEFPLDVYCSTDDAVVCERCIRSGVHNGHAVMLWDDFLSTASAEVQNYNHQLKTLEEKLDHQARGVLDGVTELKARVTEQQSMVRKSAEESVASIRRQCDGSVLLLEQYQVRCSTLLKEAHAHVSQVKAGVENARSTLTQITSDISSMPARSIGGAAAAAWSSSHGSGVAATPAEHPILARARKVHEAATSAVSRALKELPSDVFFTKVRGAPVTLQVAPQVPQLPNQPPAGVCSVGLSFQALCFESTTIALAPLPDSEFHARLRRLGAVPLIPSALYTRCVDRFDGIANAETVELTSALGESLLRRVRSCFPNSERGIAEETQAQLCGALYLLMLSLCSGVRARVELWNELGGFKTLAMVLKHAQAQRFDQLLESAVAAFQVACNPRAYPDVKVTEYCMQSECLPSLMQLMTSHSMAHVRLSCSFIVRDVIAKGSIEWGKVIGPAQVERIMVAIHGRREAVRTVTNMWMILAHTTCALPSSREFLLGSNLYRHAVLSYLSLEAGLPEATQPAFRLDWQEVLPKLLYVYRAPPKAPALCSSSPDEMPPVALVELRWSLAHLLTGLPSQSTAVQLCRLTVLTGLVRNVRATKTELIALEPASKLTQYFIKANSSTERAVHQLCLKTLRLLHALSEGSGRARIDMFKGKLAAPLVTVMTRFIDSWHDCDLGLRVLYHLSADRESVDALSDLLESDQASLKRVLTTHQNAIASDEFYKRHQVQKVLEDTLMKKNK